MMAAKEKPKKRRGRPKGSKNVGVVVRVPPRRCMACKSTDVVMNGCIRKLDQHGVGTDGEPFTSVSWHAAVCKSCGQRVVARRTNFDPSLWRGEKP